MPRVITITSGKGGVGKTNISLNVALYLASQGKKTCLFDADLGLANINILLGLQPEYTLKDLVLEGRDLEDIMVKNYEGIDILPGSSGVQELANLSEDKTADLIKSLSQLQDYDFLLFDTSAGISRNVISFCLAALEVVVVITPEPTSLTDAYSLVKVLTMNDYQGKLSVIINQCKDFSVAKSVYAKFRGALQKYLGVQIQPLGVVFEDQNVVRAVEQQKPILVSYPGSTATQCIKKIAQKLIEGGGEELPEVEIGGFWKKWWSAIRSPLKLKEAKPGGEVSRPASGGQSQKEEPERPVQDDSGVPSRAEKQKPLISGAKKPVEQEFSGAIMEQVAKSLVTVSEELRLIRNALERNGTSGGLSRGNKGRGTGLGVEKIKLDLEGFLKAKGLKNSEQGEQDA